jgi:hypothetical protein
MVALVDMFFIALNYVYLIHSSIFISRRHIAAKNTQKETIRGTVDVTDDAVWPLDGTGVADHVSSRHFCGRIKP